MTMNRPTIRLAAAPIAAILLASVLTGSATAGQTDLQKAKAATAQFHDLAVAGNAGFGQPPASMPLHFCISSLDNTGAMGFHYINGGNLNNITDPSKPGVLVYAPDKHGRLHLAALEYVIFQTEWFKDHAADTMPEMFGQPMMANNGVRFQIPPFFALHVWLFQSNPSGEFAPFNPNVSCDSASASAGRSTAAGKAAVAITTASARRWSCEVAARIA
jgi:hypothetical protein